MYRERLVTMYRDGSRLSDSPTKRIKYSEHIHLYDSMYFSRLLMSFKVELSVENAIFKIRPGIYQI